MVNRTEGKAYQLASKTFDWAAQHEFAKLSGDRNPMHMDGVAARRTQAGWPVLHGMNAGLWALDQLALHELIAGPLAECKIRFLKLMYVGETASVWVVRNQGMNARAELRVGGTPTVSISITRGALAPAADETCGAKNLLIRDVPAVWRLDELGGKSGRFPFSTDAAKVFPDIARVAGEARVNAMAAISGLVGMEVPGLYSMSSSYSIKFEEGGEESNSLGFHVDEVDERFRLVTQSVYGGGIRATVVAIARVPPVVQAPMEAVAKHAVRDEFAGALALVIGGSRGLGEVTAKLVAAGGGRVVITYAVGREEAEAVRDEIRAWGGACDAMPLDVRLPAAEQLANLAGSPTHLYYFATNPIFRRVDAIFSPGLFSDFYEFYVSGFYNVCTALRDRHGEPLRVFYPSSSAVGERPAGMTEYAMAKAAGEALCEDMMRGMPDVRIVVARLPRLPTDQTVTTALVEVADPVDVLLPLVRQVQSA